MATEITCNVVIAEIEEGREYFVEVSSGRIAVLVEGCGGRKYLRTDPDTSAENHLLWLPPC